MVNVAAIRVGGALAAAAVVAVVLIELEVGAVSSLWLPEDAAVAVAPCAQASLDACTSAWASKVALFVELRAKRRHSAAHRTDGGAIPNFVKVAFDPYGTCCGCLQAVRVSADVDTLHAPHALLQIRSGAVSVEAARATRIRTSTTARSGCATWASCLATTACS
jgi:hypothetical protein